MVWVDHLGILCWVGDMKRRGHARLPSVLVISQRPTSTPHPNTRSILHLAHDSFCSRDPYTGRTGFTSLIDAIMSKLFKRSASSASIKPQQSLGTGNDQESIVTDDSRLPTERKVSKSMSMRFGPKRRSSTASSVVVNDGNDTASSIRGDEESDSPRRKNTIGLVVGRFVSLLPIC
jgi:hypothetical protein